MSEILNDGKGVFSGTGMPDMWDSAWLAVKTETQGSESTVDANSVNPSQKGVDKLLVTASFSLDEETVVKRRRAEMSIAWPTVSGALSSEFVFVSRQPRDA